MGIFRSSDPVAAAAVELGALEERVFRFRRRLDDAEAHHRRTLDDRQQVLLSAADDSGKVEAANAQVRAAEDAALGWRGALAIAEEKCRDAKTRLARLQDQAERERVAANMATVHADITAKLEALRVASVALIDALRQVDAAALLAQQGDFTLGSFRDQANILLADLERQRQALLAGAPLKITIAERAAA